MRGERALLHGDGLGEVAGLVDVAAARLGGGVGEHLQGHDRRQRLQQGRDRGHGDRLVGKRDQLVITFRNDGQNLTATGADLLDVRDDLAAQGMLPGERHRGKFAIDEGDGTVLHLAGGRSPRHERRRAPSS